MMDFWGSAPGNSGDEPLGDHVDADAYEVTGESRLMSRITYERAFEA
jgi:hypothetical protein